MFLWCAITQKNWEAHIARCKGHIIIPLIQHLQLGKQRKGVTACTDKEPELYQGIMGNPALAFSKKHTCIYRVFVHCTLAHNHSNARIMTWFKLISFLFKQLLLRKNQHAYCRKTSPTCHIHNKCM